MHPVALIYDDDDDDDDDDDAYPMWAWRLLSCQTGRNCDAI